MFASLNERLAAVGAAVLVAGAAGLAAVPASAQIRVSPTVNPAARAVQQGIHELARTSMFPRLKINRERVASVNEAAISPGGHWMATAQSDGRLVLWDLDQGRELRRVTSHVGEALTIAWDSSGRRLATGGADGIARVWVIDRAAPIAALAGHTGPVRAVALTPDGATAATGGDDGTVRLWDVANGGAERRRIDVGSPVQAVAIGSGGRLFTGGGDGNVRIWEVGTGTGIGEFAVDDGAVTALALSADGRLLVVGSEDETVQVWDTDSGERIHRLTDFDDAVLAVAISDDGSLIAAGGGDRTVRVFDAASGDEQKVFQGHGDAVTSVAFAANGASILSASRDGTSRVWDRPSGEPVADIISSDSGWTVVSDDGLFDGNEADSSDTVGWQVDEETWALAQFTETHYEPALLTRALDGSLKAAEPETSLADDGVAAPPVVEISEPGDGLTVESDIITVAVAATDRGGGVSEIRVFHNGKRVDDSGARLAKFSAGESDRQVKTVQIELVPGDNTISAVALSDQQVEGAADEVKVSLAAAEPETTLHLFTVGVNEYRNPALNLNYGVADAQGLQDFFATASLPFFKEVKTEGLFDGNATRGNIIAQLGAYESLPPQDIVLIYLAGHGETVEDEWYFLPHEMAYPEKEEEVVGHGISATMLKDLIAKMGAQKVLVLVDACKSGAALVAARGVEERKVIRRLARSTGTHIVAAAGKDQFATEIGELGHGVFTYALLQGLDGKADGAPRDGVVTVRELVSFVEYELPEISQLYKSQPQFPVVDSRGQDFPLAGTM